MKRSLPLLALASLAFAAAPAYATLPKGATAPAFVAKGAQAGKPITFDLAKALKKGPVVLYFFPAAFTPGCNIEAETFAEAMPKFQAAGASVLGVSADSLDRLHQFSADPNFCAGKFPIASDADTKVAKSYDLSVGAAREGAKDVRGQEIGHAFIERVTYVIGRNGKVLATLSSKSDGLSPDQHVDKSLEIITAAK